MSARLSKQAKKPAAPRTRSAPEPAPAAPVQEQPATPAPVTPPAPATVVEQPATPEPPTATETVSPTSEVAKPHKPAGFVAARIEKFLVTKGLNRAVSEELAELKPRVKQYNDAAEALASGKVKALVEGDVKKRVERDITDAERAGFTALVESQRASHEQDVEHLARLSSCKFRFATDADSALAGVCDWLVSDLALHAKATAKSRSMKMATVDCLYSEGLERLPSFGLVKGTKLYRSTHYELYSKHTVASHSAALASALVSQERDLKKKWRDAGLLTKTPRKKDLAKPEEVVEKPAEPQEAAKEPTPEPEHPAKMFHHYVAIIIDSAGDRETYSSMRKSQDLTHHIAELVRQFVERVVTQLSLVMRLTDAKTVTLDHICAIVQGFVVDGSSPTQTLASVETQVPEKTALAAELAKRKSEKDAGRQYKINYDALPKVMGVSRKLVVSFQEPGYETVAAICGKFRRQKK